VSAAAKPNRDAELVDKLITRLRPGTTRVTGPYSNPLPTLSVAARSGNADEVYVAPARTTPVSRVPVLRSPMGIRGFVVLSLLLGIALPYWPYGNSCGWSLVFHGLAVMTLVTAGVWTSILTWYSRLGMSHIFAVLILCWGLALSAADVLPRTGYSKAEATWWCATN
jgi:hypothetical protein